MKGLRIVSAGISSEHETSTLAAGSAAEKHSAAVGNASAGNKTENAAPDHDTRQSVQTGISYYNRGNYTAALAVLSAEATRGNAEAEYYTSVMYGHGYGTAADPARSEFWLKKAADDQYTEAQYAYACTLLSRRSGTEPLSKEGMDYLEKAADKDFQPAMKKYVEIILKGYREQPAIDKAIRYSAELQKLLTDPYEIDVCKKNEEQLKSIQTEYERLQKQAQAATKKRKNKKLFNRILKFAGPVLLIAGFVYLFGGCHPRIWNENVLLRRLPDAPEKWILQMKLLWKLVPLSVTVNGKFGLELIVLSGICKTIRDSMEEDGFKSLFLGFFFNLICLMYYAVFPKKNPYSYRRHLISGVFTLWNLDIKCQNVWYTVAEILALILTVWHFVLVFAEKQPVSDGIVLYSLALVERGFFAAIAGGLLYEAGKVKGAPKKVMCLVLLFALIFIPNVIL